MSKQLVSTIPADMQTAPGRWLAPVKPISLDRLLGNPFGPPVDLVAEAVRELREALRADDDGVIAQAARHPHLHRDSLHASERARLDAALARHQALTDLGAGVRAGDDARTVEAWWRTVRLGCAVPPPLYAAAQAARRRRTSDYSPPPSHWRPPQVPPSTTSPARQYVNHLLDKRTRADQALAAALGTGSDAAIVIAARDVRQTGAPATNLPWDTVCAVEQRTADLDALRASLQVGKIEPAARAWAKANSLHPTALDPDLDGQGRAAFRNWGRVLRHRMRRRQSTDES